MKVIDEVSSGNGSKDWAQPLPYFDLEKFPFMMVTGKSNFSLLNIRTGKLEAIIKGSSQTSKGSQPAFFVKLKNGFELHFTTRASLQTKQYDYSYHCLHFKEDFVQILTDYGTLPFDSVQRPLQVIRDLQEEQITMGKTIEKLEKEKEEIQKRKEELEAAIALMEETKP